jgi:hypothetical protein
VHRQLIAPVASLAVAAIPHYALARWNFWLALAAGAAAYCAGLVWWDGRRLASFAKLLIGRI